jgi:hypothetical protein
MLYKIWVFHCGDYNECSFLGYYAMWLLYEPCFGGIYRLHHQGRKNQKATNNVSSK